MAFRRTYDEILELIKRKLLETKLARDIVRKSGIRQGSGEGPEDGDPGALFKGGGPWDAITKLSETEFDVGWRKFGLGPNMRQTWNSGPPCNLRVSQWARLRDSLLRSGTANSGRFGYAFDAHGLHTAGLGTTFNPIRIWYERRAPVEREFVMYQVGARVSGTLTATRRNDAVQNVVKDQARIIAYVTRADWPYRFNIYLFRDPTTETLIEFYQRSYSVDLSTTGRYVSDWFDFAAVDPSLDASQGGARPWGDGAVYVQVGPVDPDSVSPMSVPTTHGELREGVGPFAMPFLEVEVRTVYYPESSYWVQDENTPADYKVAQWENEV